VAITVVALGVLAFLVTPLDRYAGWAWRRLTGGVTVEQRLEQYGPAARDRLKPFFDAAGIEYPPSKLVLIGIKDTKQLELWGLTPFGNLDPADMRESPWGIDPEKGFSDEEATFTGTDRGKAASG
jgi:hypothetical protein